MPLVGADTSTLTLSVSSSHSISSRAITSPMDLNQVLTVASVTDSPKVGTDTKVTPSILFFIPTSLALAGNCSASVALVLLISVIVANKASIPTESPSRAIMSLRVPSIGDGTSTVTLSVSSSQSISSTATISPGFLNHVATVAVVTLSPNVGTRTSVVICLSFDSQRFVDKSGLLSFVNTGQTCRG